MRYITKSKTKLYTHIGAYTRDTRYTMVYTTIPIFGYSWTYKSSLDFTRIIQLQMIKYFKYAFTFALTIAIDLESKTANNVGQDCNCGSECNASADLHLALGRDTPFVSDLCISTA